LLCSHGKGPAFNLYHQSSQYNSFHWNNMTCMDKGFDFSSCFMAITLIFRWSSSSKLWLKHLCSVEILHFCKHSSRMFLTNSCLMLLRKLLREQLRDKRTLPLDLLGLTVFFLFIIFSWIRSHLMLDTYLNSYYKTDRFWP